MNLKGLFVFNHDRQSVVYGNHQVVKLRLLKVNTWVAGRWRGIFVGRAVRSSNFIV